MYLCIYIYVWLIHNTLLVLVDCREYLPHSLSHGKTLPFQLKTVPKWSILTLFLVINQSNSRPKEFLGTSICSAVHVHTVEAGHFPSQSYNMHASCVTGAWKVIWRWSKSCRGRIDVCCECWLLLMLTTNAGFADFWCWKMNEHWHGIGVSLSGA